MGKKVHLEIIRFIAVCLVIFNHTDGYFLYFSATDNIVTYSVSLFFSALCKINVPLFFMVTGALLIPKEEEIKELYRKRVSRIVAVIVVFSAVQYAAMAIGRQKEITISFSEFLRMIYSGNVIEPYWFLYSYLAILMMMPFLRKMVKGGMGNEEFCYLFLLKIIIDIICRIAGVYSGIKINLSLFMLADNVFYVLFGYYMEHVLPKEMYEKPRIGKAVSISAAVLVLSMAAVIVENKIKGAYSQELLGIFNPILVITVYYMVKSICTGHRWNDKVESVILYLGSTVFGIYLIEQLVRRQLLPLYLYLCQRTIGLVACFVYVVGTLVLSVIYVSILKRIPGIKKMI